MPLQTLKLSLGSAIGHDVFVKDTSLFERERERECGVLSFQNLTKNLSTCAVYMVSIIFLSRQRVSSTITRNVFLTFVPTRPSMPWPTTLSGQVLHPVGRKNNDGSIAGPGSHYGMRRGETLESPPMHLSLNVSFVLRIAHRLTMSIVFTALRQGDLQTTPCQHSNYYIHDHEFTYTLAVLHVI